MDRTAVAFLVALSLVAVTVSAGHGEPAPVTVEKVYEVGLLGYGISWEHPLFGHLTEDGSIDISFTFFKVPNPEGATHPPTVQLRIEDRVVDGDVAMAVRICHGHGCDEDIPPDYFCGESPPLPTDSEDFVLVRILGPLAQSSECPDSDNQVGGVHGTVTATFSWE